MTFREFTGKNVEEAIRTAMKEFSSDLGDLDIEILSQGSRGLLGVGGEEARILAAPKSAVAAAETVRAEPIEEPRIEPAEPEFVEESAPEEMPTAGVDAADDQVADLARWTRPWRQGPQRARARARHPRARGRAGSARAAIGPTGARAGTIRLGQARGGAQRRGALHA
jgi:spoIIIJ-associated protein